MKNNLTENIVIKDYNSKDELEWLDVHASVMVDSYAWWGVLHKKSVHKNEVVDLVACHNQKIVGFTVAEINAEIEKVKNSAFVWDFGVHRNYRSNNIGRMMIERLHEIINEKYGITKSIWYTQDPDSQKYYEHTGMKEIGRHWQLTVKPTREQFDFFKKDKFGCWNMRGDCSIEDLEEVKKKFNVIEDDDNLKPMLCIGYEFIK